MGWQKVSVRKKSSWQKDDCLWCQSKAVLEASYKAATIRCCRKKACIKESKLLAVKLGAGL